MGFINLIPVAKRTLQRRLYKMRPTVGQLIAMTSQRCGACSVPV